MFLVRGRNAAWQCFRAKCEQKNMNNLQEKILNKIEQENLKPTSWEYFLFKKYTIYFTLLLSVIFSALSFSALLFIFTNLDWFYAKDLEDNIYLFVWRHFPLFWLVLSAVFISLSVYIWKNSERGYRYAGKTVFGVLAFFVVVFGFALNQFQMGRMLDRQFVYANIHESFEDKRERVWNRPDKQRILGTIKDIDTQKGIFVLEDRKFLWEIKISDIEVGQENIIFDNKVKMLCRYAEKCQLINFD
jgi:hypothetical protein